MDFYYDFRNVETVKSEYGRSFFSVDLDFRYINFNSFDSEKEEITNYNCAVSWMKNIGMSVATDNKKQEISKLKDEFGERQYSLYNPKNKKIVHA